MATTDGFSEVMAAIRGQRSRSPLYRWLSDNYARIQAAKAEGGKSDWIRTALELNKMGVRTADGKKLKGETVRRIWWRVCRDMKAATNAAPTMPTASRVVRPAVPVAPAALPAEASDPSGTDFGFRVLKKGK